MVEGTMPEQAMKYVKAESALLQQIQAEQERPTRCMVGKALEALEDADRRGLVIALGDATIYGSSIEKVLAQRGFKVGKDGVQRHRRNVCSCRGNS